MYKTVLNSTRESNGFVKYKIISSAIRLILCIVWSTFTPFISLVLSDCLGQITKSSGDKGHPCLLDLLRERAVDICPLVIILACGFL